MAVVVYLLSMGRLLVYALLGLLLGAVFAPALDHSASVTVWVVGMSVGLIIGVFLALVMNRIIGRPLYDRTDFRNAKAYQASRGIQPAVKERLPAWLKTLFH